MKRYNSWLLIFCIALSATIISACSMPEGNLIPVPQEGLVLSDSFTPKDTIETTTDKARIKILGNWEAKNSVRFFLAVENTGKEPIKIDFAEVELTGTDVIKTELNALTDKENLLESSESADKEVYYWSADKNSRDGTTTVTIKSGETKNYRLSFFIFKTDNKLLSSGDEAQFSFPQKIWDATGLKIDGFKFKMVSSSDLKYIKRGAGRKTEY